MSQLDFNPFWHQHRNTLIRDYLRPPRGGEFKISVLEAKLKLLFGENATSSNIYKELVRARKSFNLDGPYRAPRGWESEKGSNYDYHHLHFPAVLHEGTPCPRRTMIKLKPRSLTPIAREEGVSQMVGHKGFFVLLDSLYKLQGG